VLLLMGEHVEYDPHEGIGADVCLGYHVQGAAIVAVQQAVAELVQMCTSDLHVREVVVVVVAAGARGWGGTPLLRRWRREVGPQQGAQP
jgi:hypothetical protein